MEIGIGHNSRILDYADLNARGIKLSKTSLWRLMREGLFPKAVKIGKQQNGWLEVEIDRYLEQQIAKHEVA